MVWLGLAPACSSSDTPVAPEPCWSDAECDDYLACTDDYCVENVGCAHVQVTLCASPSTTPGSEPPVEPTLAWGGLVATGACADPGGTEGRFELGFRILGPNGSGVILPTDSLGDVETVEDVLGAANLRFVRPPHQADDPPVVAGAGTNAFSDDTTYTLTPTSVRFDWTGGVSRQADERLVVLLVDSSGSLSGQGSSASDPDGRRITFLQNLVRSTELPEDTSFSLVWFSGDAPEFNAAFAKPTQDRTVFVCPEGDAGEACRADAERDGLARLRGAETDGTPLALTLKKVYQIILSGSSTQALNPLVVVVTDGVEDGDTSANGVPLDEAVALYTDHAPAPVPVVVVHLQSPDGVPWPRGPDASLQSIACATGGDYLCLSGLTTRFGPVAGASPCRAGSWWLVGRGHATRAGPGLELCGNTWELAAGQWSTVV